MSRLLVPGCLAGAVIVPAAAETPTIVALNAPRLWERAEFRVDGAPSAANPFDPALVRLDASFTPPSGGRLSVPAFWYQDYSDALVDAREVLTPVGPPHWRIRFTPTEPGGYTLSLTIRIQGSPVGDPVVVHFTVPGGEPEARHGWVRVAPDRRWFETSDGRPLRLIGENVCWSDEQGAGTFDYERWFSHLEAAGGNFARLWLAPWFLPLEHKPGTLNRYDLGAAWQIDRIFELAARHHLYVLLCLDHHGMFQVGNQNWGGSNNFWTRNPYSQAAGGPCAQPNDFFTDAGARALYEKRLRYLVGRYGDSPQLLAWQFFNEIDNVYGPLKGEDVLAWHRDMGARLRALDPYHHLVTTSLTGGSVRPEIWEIPEMDFSMYHSYGDASPADRVSALAHAFVRRDGKPMMIGEFGTSAANWNSPADPFLRGFRQGLWGGALGGSVGTAMSWWWDDIDRENVYPVYAAMHRILTAGGWEEGSWEPVEFAGAGSPPTDLAAPVPNGAPFSVQLPLSQARRYRMTGEFAIADRLVAQRSADALAARLDGSTSAPAGARNTIGLVAFIGEHGALALRVRPVDPGAELVVRVDGREATRATLDPPAPGALPGATTREFPVPLGGGKHHVEIANEGTGALVVEMLRIDGVRPAEFPAGWRYGPGAVGLRSGTKAIVYAYSPWISWPASAHRYNPPIVTGESLRLAGWADGAYTATWLDPRTGAPVGVSRGRVAGGVLALPLPDFNEDLAGIVAAAPEP